MNPSEIPLGALAALLTLVAPLLVGQDAPTPAPGGLQRVAPTMQGDEEDLAQIYSRGFDPRRWRELLATPDLDRRERHFDVLVKRADFDPAARAFLEELARDPAGGEAAWTARLALRELGRTHFPLRGFFSGNEPLLPGSFGPGGSFEELLRELMGQDGRGVFLSPPGFHRDPPRPGADEKGGSPAAGRSVHLEQTERGARMEIVDHVGGEERRRVFEGATIEEILERDPGLRQELGDLQLRVEATAPLDPRHRPQRPTRPLRTDKLGVLVEKLGPQRARELALDQQGLHVERSYPGTYAHLLGVVSGDVLVELDGRPLREVEDIEVAMRARAPEDELTLVWIDQLGQRQAKTWRAQGEEK